jgi:hypothetical protein
MGFEPMMRVLQTLALPLGHVAVYSNEGYCTLRLGKCQPWSTGVTYLNQKPPEMAVFF